MCPGLTTPGWPAWELVVWRPGSPVCTSPWIPGLPEEVAWFCRPGEPWVGAVPEDAGENNEMLIHSYINIITI